MCRSVLAQTNPYVFDQEKSCINTVQKPFRLCFPSTAKNVLFTLIKASFLHRLKAHWLISIVNKRNRPWSYSLCDASTSESGQFFCYRKKQIDFSFFQASALLLTMNFVITLAK